MSMLVDCSMADQRVSPATTQLIFPQRPIRRLPILPALLLLALFLFGCRTQAIRLWTNHPEAVIFAETYNVTQLRYRMELVYISDLDEALLVNEERPDVIIGDYLGNRANWQYFRPLDSLLRRNSIDEDWFYPDLLQLGKNNRRQLLLPVAFNLPAVQFLRSQADPEFGFSVTLDQIRQSGSQFNRTERERFSRIGFSPRWHPSLLYVGVLLFGADFAETRTGSLQWGAQAIERASSYFIDWIDTENGGIEREDAFNRRYIYDPDYQLLQRGRIRYAYTDSEAYFLESASRRRSLDFRWLATETTIPVLDDILFAAISTESTVPRGAQDFLRWLFQPATQQILLEAMMRKRALTFGIAGGFSALISVNEQYLPAVYYQLLGRIPPVARLQFPQQSPQHWDRLRAEVIEPWLAESLTNDAIDLLEERVRVWHLQVGL